MKPIIIQNSKIPQRLSIFINIGAITLYPFIISRGEMDETTINHEKIHLAQQRELWLIGFYLLYVYFWLKSILKGKSSLKAYLDIPFEREAYHMQEDMEYLEKRPKNAWMRYLVYPQANP